MTEQDMFDRYLLARILWWRHDLEQLDAEAVASVLSTLDAAQKDIANRLDAEAAGLAQLSDWRREQDAAFNAWADEVLAGARASVSGAVSEASIAAAVASLAAYNAILSLDGRAKAVRNVGLTSAQIASWFQDTALGSAGLEQWVNTAFDNGVKKAVLDALRKAGVEGKGTAETVRRVMRAATTAGFEITRREAITITRTFVQTANVNAQEAVYQANKGLIKGYKRVETLDNRTCLICFVGSTKVQPIGALKAVSKRLYSGEVVIITTAAGNELIGTPHHPILTPRGWLPLQELKPGDEVINAVFHDRISGGDAEQVAMPASFAELFDAVSSDPSMEIVDVGASANDFHGDGMGTDKNVHIARSALFLRDKIGDARLDKQIKNSLFTRRQNPVRFLGGSSTFSLFNRARKAFRMSRQLPIVFSKSGINPRCTARNSLFYLTQLNSIVKKLQKPLYISLARRIPFISGSIFHNTQSNQETCDSRRSNTILFSELTSRYSLSIRIDNIVSMRRKTTFEYVYNLSCNEELYIANGLVVKNCALADGAEYSVDEERPALPAHPRCRGLWLPICKTWRDFGIDVPDLEAVARPWAIREPGPIGTGGRKILNYGKTTEKYSGWWRSLSAADKARTPLGPVRTKLLESGAVKWDQMWDRRTGLPLTLEEMGYDQRGNRLNGKK